MRYVELNPVGAGIVVKAEKLVYSSAAAHLVGKDSSMLLDMDF